MKEIKLIKNEQHSLLPCQEKILARLNGEIKTVNIPAKGLTYGFSIMTLGKKRIA